MNAIAEKSIQTRYYPSFSWRYFFSVGFFYWHKENMGLAREHLPAG